MPFLTWHGYGQLLKKSGAKYPLYVSLLPSSHFSQLHLQSLRPTGGLRGSGWLCTAPGVTQRPTLSGTIYRGWRSTDGSLFAVRLLEFNTAQTTFPRNLFVGMFGFSPATMFAVQETERASVTCGSN